VDMEFYSLYKIVFFNTYTNIFLQNTFGMNATILETTVDNIWLINGSVIHVTLLEPYCTFACLGS
jgi:hypothetical protein